MSDGSEIDYCRWNLAKEDYKFYKKIVAYRNKHHDAGGNKKMTKTYCDICGKETTKSSVLNITLNTYPPNRCVSVNVFLDICDDCKNSSGLLEEIWDSSDFTKPEFEDLFKRKLVKMIKEKEK